MSVTKLYLIRHGESQANAAHRYIGQTDLDLTEFGHAQAEATAEFLKNVPVDVIYASDLIRAYHTAEHTAKKKGMPIVKDPGLREIYAGRWEDKSMEELRSGYPTFRIWSEDIGNSRCDEGESVKELHTRIAAEVESLARKHEGQTIFLFTHATPIRSLAAYWATGSLDGMKDLQWAPNASVTSAEYSDGVFRLLEYGRSDFLEGVVPPDPKKI